MYIGILEQVRKNRILAVWRRNWHQALVFQGFRKHTGLAAGNSLSLASWSISRAPNSASASKRAQLMTQPITDSLKALGLIPAHCIFTQTVCLSITIITAHE